MRKDGPDCDKLCEMLSVLVIKEGTLPDLDNGIEDETPMDELEVEIATTQDYQDSIITLKARVDRLMRMTRDPVSERMSERMSGASSGTIRSESRQTVKLPKLVIENYDGDVSQWQEFWSQYETAIHENDALCKREKFTYLRSYLTGTAARAVAGLMHD